MDKNRYLTRLTDIDDSINWSKHRFNPDGALSGRFQHTIDARMVKSASRPVSNDKLGELREKQDTTEGG